MKQYIFILGHSPLLSIAEIMSVFPGRKAVFVSLEVLILELPEIDVSLFMKRLGGTIKIGEVVSQTNEKNLSSSLVNILKDNLPDGKILFGLSFYGLAKSKLGLEVKSKLKAQNLKARWVVSKNANLSSADLVKSRLLKKGLEVLLIKTDNEVLIGKTLAVQEFEAYSKRDYGRPARDSRSGMLPPKVAKMMINLAQIKTSQTLLDPFCGSGTILQEALLMGYLDVWGSDISPKAIKDSQINLKWLKDRMGLDGYDQLSHVKQIDAEKLSDYFEEDYFEAIVTEPYLGPPLKGRETKEEIKGIIKELTDIYLHFFVQARIILKKKGRLIIILPVFSINGKKEYLPVMEEIKKIGFKIKNPLMGIKGLELSQRDSIIYSRSNQLVCREIMVLEV